MTRVPPPDRFRRREDSRQRTATRDPYRTSAKPAQPARCPGCGLVFEEGRWGRAGSQSAPGGMLCPACRRIGDRNPAGVVRLGGPFVAEHREEVLATVRRVAAREGFDHPLERLVETRDEGEEIVVTTTGVHLARAIGQALAHAWDGALEIEDEDAVVGVRVAWHR